MPPVAQENCQKF